MARKQKEGEEKKLQSLNWFPIRISERVDNNIEKTYVGISWKKKENDFNNDHDHANDDADSINKRLEKAIIGRWS